jgi:hypothetical protein
VRIVDRDAAEGILGEDGGIRHRNRGHHDHQTPHRHRDRLDSAGRYADEAAGRMLKQAQARVG